MKEHADLLRQQAEDLQATLSSMGFKLSPQQAQKALEAAYGGEVFKNVLHGLPRLREQTSSGRVTILLADRGTELFDMAIGNAFRAAKSGLNVHTFDPLSLPKDKMGSTLKRLHFWVTLAKDATGELLVVEDVPLVPAMANSLNQIETLALDRGWAVTFVTNETEAPAIAARHRDRPIRTVYLAEEEGFVPLSDDPADG